MSADNCVIIGSFPEWYRVLHCQASENLSFEEYVYPYFKDISPTQSKDEAYKIASDIYKAEDYVEYWIREITFMNTLDTYKKIYLWHYIWECIDSTFNKDIMKSISNDVHKQSDWIINISYDYYQNERTISHNWYIRDKIISTDDSLERASYKYCSYIKAANNDELKDVDLNRKLPKDRHVAVIDGNYELYYKWDIIKCWMIVGDIENDVMKVIKDYPKDLKKSQRLDREPYRWLYIETFPTWHHTTGCNIYDKEDTFLWCCQNYELNWFIDNLKQLYKIK